MATIDFSIYTVYCLVLILAIILYGIILDIHRWRYDGISTTTLLTVTGHQNHMIHFITHKQGQMWCVYEVL